MTTHRASCRCGALSAVATGEPVQLCPTCGGQLNYRIEAMPGVVAIALGMFDDPHAFTPTVSVWESRKHDWIEIAGAIEHD
ncbi:MAG: GFA family protein [Pseudomonadota bacterium]